MCIAFFVLSVSVRYLLLCFTTLLLVFGVTVSEKQLVSTEDKNVPPNVLFFSISF